MTTTSSVGLFGKIKETVKNVKEEVKETIGEVKEIAKDVKEGVKETVKNIKDEVFPSKTTKKPDFNISSDEANEAIENAKNEVDSKEIDDNKKCGIFGAIKRIFGNDKEEDKVEKPAKSETMDGIIGNTDQRGTGDCWLLSGVSALSYTEAGKEAIKEALDYQDNGDTIVHLKGIGDYTVTKEELDKIRQEQANGSREYSIGDDDMLIMELAIEKVMDGLANVDFKFNNPAFEDRFDILRDVEENGISVWGGHCDVAMYLITGKEPSRTYDSEEIKTTVNLYDGTNVALGASVSEDAVVKDINGNDVVLNGPHAYAIKNVDENTVTITNPWDTSKDIVVSKEVFFENISGIYSCNLESSDANYIIYPDKIDSDGNKTYYQKTEDWITYYNNNGEQIYPEYSTEKWSKDGALIETGNADSNKNQMSLQIQEKDADGNAYNLKEKIDYFQDGTKGISKKYNESGEVESYQIYEFDESGNKKAQQSISDAEQYETICDREILTYEQFNLKEVCKLAKLEENEWGIAQKLLNKNPNISYAEIIKTIKEANEMQEVA